MSVNTATWFDHARDYARAVITTRTETKMRQVHDPYQTLLEFMRVHGHTQMDPVYKIVKHLQETSSAIANAAATQWTQYKAVIYEYNHAIFNSMLSTDTTIVTRSFKTITLKNMFDPTSNALWARVNRSSAWTHTNGATSVFRPNRFNLPNSPMVPMKSLSVDVEECDAEYARMTVETKARFDRTMSQIRLDSLAVYAAEVAVGIEDVRSRVITVRFDVVDEEGYSVDEFNYIVNKYASTWGDHISGTTSMTVLSAFVSKSIEDMRAFGTTDSHALTSMPNESCDEVATFANTSAALELSGMLVENVDVVLAMFEQVLRVDTTPSKQRSKVEREIRRWKSHRVKTIANQQKQLGTRQCASERLYEWRCRINTLGAIVDSCNSLCEEMNLLLDAISSGEITDPHQAFEFLLSNMRSCTIRPENCMDVIKNYMIAQNVSVNLDLGPTRRMCSETLSELHKSVTQLGSHTPSVTVVPRFKTRHGKNNPLWCEPVPTAFHTKLKSGAADVLARVSSISTVDRTSFNRWRDDVEEVRLLTTQETPRELFTYLEQISSICVLQFWLQELSTQE
jgi:hypothetical protein